MYKCAWCGKQLENKKAVSEDSHGICKSCVKKHFPKAYKQWKE